jgi:hypothetical protein
MPKRIVAMTSENWDAIRATIYDLELARAGALPALEQGQIMARVQNDQALFGEAIRGWSEEFPPDPGNTTVTWSNR